MGSSDKDKHDNLVREKQVVTIETTNLKKRLNDAFVTLHSRHGSHDANFDRLWDLKESAILEGRKTVELPGQWLNELDEIDSAETRH